MNKLSVKEIDAILSEDKMLGKKEEMWERLNIKSYDKSILCKLSVYLYVIKYIYKKGATPITGLRLFRCL